LASCERLQKRQVVADIILEFRDFPPNGGQQFVGLPPYLAQRPFYEFRVLTLVGDAVWAPVVVAPVFPTITFSLVARAI